MRSRKLGMGNGGGEDKDNCGVDENIGDYDDDGVSGSVFGQERTSLRNLMIEQKGRGRKKKLQDFILFFGGKGKEKLEKKKEKKGILDAL